MVGQKGGIYNIRGPVTHDIGRGFLPHKITCVKIEHRGEQSVPEGEPWYSPKPIHSDEFMSTLKQQYVLRKKERRGKRGN